MYQILSIYSQSSTHCLREGERQYIHMQGTAYISTIEKSSYHKELVSHATHADELSSLQSA